MALPNDEADGEMPECLLTYGRRVCNLPFHSHHGYGKDGGNYRNFGIFLSIYDWMFGTLHIPKARPARYGLPDPTPHWADDAFSPLNIGRMLARVSKAVEGAE